MTEIKPQFLDEESYAAKFDRQHLRDILTEGIVATGDLEITELDTPGMGVKAASGAGYVQGDQAATQGHYRIFNDASKNLTIAASDPTNPRKDRIIAQVYDSIDIGGADDKWVLEVLTGTPAASPVVPALPDDALDLAIVDVAANETTILDAHITDQRIQIALQNVGGGEITVEDIVNNVKARAYPSAILENIPTVTYIKVLLDTESYDIGSDFDTTNKWFIAPVDGYYFIKAQATWKNDSVIANKRYGINIYKNDSAIISSHSHSSNTKLLTNNISDIVFLNANDKIELYVFHEAGVNTPDLYGTSGFTFMTIHLLSV